jgi:hypothetical protein
MFSFLTDALDRQTCLGYYCADIAREYMCCAFSANRREKWSQASSGVLNCGGGGSAVGIVFLVLFLLTLLTLVIVGVVVGIVFVIRRRGRAAGSTSYESVY